MTNVKEKLKPYFGDKAFYRMVLAVALPITIQNGISTFVSLLDNLMVGAINTEAMSGVSIVNQLIFIFNLVIFGAVSAAGIFMAQFYGKGDIDGCRRTFRFKVLICGISALLAIGILYFFADGLISVFLTGEASDVDPVLTLNSGKQYLYVMLLGLIPFAISNAYASTMRETGDTLTPMVAGIAAVATNCILNYILIFGKLGLPALGVVGAAIATVISRFAECGILVIRTHTHIKIYPYIERAYTHFRIPASLFRDIFVRGMPLMANEFFWSLAITFTNQCYSTRGLDVIPAQSIYSTLWNVMSVAFCTMGSAIGIIVGKELGAGNWEKAKDTDRKMVVFAFLIGIVSGGMIAVLSPVFPLFYNTTESVRELATYMILVSAFIAPISALTHAAYFTIRSGGDVLLTILLDSVFNWTVIVSTCFVLSRFTDINIYWMFAIGQGLDSLKAALGLYFLRRGDWVRRIVND